MKTFQITHVDYNAKFRIAEHLRPPQRVSARDSLGFLFWAAFIGYFIHGFIVFFSI